MPEPLANYIKDMLSKGYSEAQITSALIKAGYQKPKIEESFEKITPKHALFSFKILSSIIIATFGILLISYAGLKLGGKTTEQQLSIGIERLQISETKDISFILNILSNKRRKFALDMNYEVKDNKGTSIFKRSEELSFDTRAYKPINLKLPEEIEEGKYTLNVFTTHAGKRISTAETVYLQKSEETKLLLELPEESQFIGGTCFDGIKNNNEEGIDCGGECKPCIICDDNNQCTRDFIEDVVCVHEQISPCCGNAICEANEDEVSCDIDCIRTNIPLTKDAILAEIARLKQNNPEKAATYCRQLIFIIDRDSCYNEIAQTSKNTKYCAFIDSTNKKGHCFSIIANSTGEAGLCGSIKSEAIRDSCYVNFILSGDYSYCEKLSNNYLRESCRLLER